MDHWKTLDEARVFWFAESVNARQRWHEMDHETQRCLGNGSDTEPWSAEKFNDIGSELEGDLAKLLRDHKEHNDSSTWWEEDSDNECSIEKEEEN